MTRTGRLAHLELLLPPFNAGSKRRAASVAPTRSSSWSSAVPTCGFAGVRY
jgi:hypothetical protein